MAKPRMLVSWSSGKESAWALHELRRENKYEIAGLMTTINSSADRVAMHAVRSGLLEAQAEAAGVAVWKIPLPQNCNDQQYAAAMARVIERAREGGIRAFAFGDLYLGRVREYREAQLAGTGLAAVFPLWGRPSDALAAQMLKGGLRAVLTCVDPKQLPGRFAGRQFDHDLLRDLPEGVDPCGERGEFHSFVYDGPMLGHPITVGVGEIVQRDGFVFADVR
ncbi:MAG: ATP-binding protein [Betaproteobacteria bacterium]|nr:MAG: ATP-binding protein [Betaproteobacteria bacterium]